MEPFIDRGDRRPRVAVAIDHPVMRSLVTELLSRELDCAVVAGADEFDRRQVNGAVIDLRHSDVELLVIDEAAFSHACSQESLPGPTTAVIVLGAEPDPSYREFALSQGAQAWLAQEQIRDELLVEAQRLLAGEAQSQHEGL
jgi:DNA-binding NarL/FixJ family response regulator